MKVAILCLLVVFVGAYALDVESPVQIVRDAVRDAEAWGDFKVTYEREYATLEEEAKRFEIFVANLRAAEDFQAKDEHAEYGVTQFMDMSPSEFADTILMKQHNAVELQEEPIIEHVEDVPTSFDWRDKGAVTPVKNQAQCGSCWAFSAGETVESAYFLAKGDLEEVSIQQIVSCDHTSYGCNGGEPYSAFNYLISCGGEESDSAYPYTSQTGITGTCKFNSADIIETISDWKWVTASPYKNETAMLDECYQYGPLSICVDASSWQYYRGGIVTSNCGERLDHCVQLVGWNTSSTNIEYWTVRNSWGVTWGEKGYIWIERNKDLCGIANEVTRVVI